MKYKTKPELDGFIEDLEDVLDGGGVPGPEGPQGPKGDTGAQGPAGKGVKAIALTTTEGAVTGGTVTFTDDSTAAITVTQSGS